MGAVWGAVWETKVRSSANGHRFEQANMKQVLICIQSLGRASKRVRGYGGPSLAVGGAAGSERGSSSSSKIKSLGAGLKLGMAPPPPAVGSMEWLEAERADKAAAENGSGSLQGTVGPSKAPATPDAASQESVERPSLRRPAPVASLSLGLGATAVSTAADESCRTERLEAEEALAEQPAAAAEATAAGPANPAHKEEKGPPDWKKDALQVGGYIDEHASWLGEPLHQCPDEPVRAAPGACHKISPSDSRSVLHGGFV